jgi:hypothetical protein
MSSTPTQLLVRKKITAIYADGSSKMNLCIATVVRMLKGATNVPVEVAADAAARKLLAELARSAGRTVERASAGLFLTPPVVQPGVEQRAVPAAPAVPAGPKPRRERGGTERSSPELCASTPPCLRHSSKGPSAVRSRPSSNRARQTPKKSRTSNWRSRTGTAPGICYLCPSPSSPNCKPSVSRSQRPQTNP